MKQTRCERKPAHARALALLLSAGLMAGLIACHPGDVENVSELDVVVTSYDKNADFGSFQTYSMPETVADLCDFIEDCSEDWEGAYDEHILTEVARNMQALGYERMPFDLDNPDDPWGGGEQPDVLLLVGGLKSKGYIVSSWYPGYPWCPYCGWGYYPYWPVTSVYQFDTGTITLNMMNWRDRESDDLVLGVWQSVLNGVAEGSSSGTRQRITNGIDQAFKQSSYLASD